MCRRGVVVFVGSVRVTPQQTFATARDLEELGIAREAIQVIPLAQRKRALKAASGTLAPYLRKRNTLPLAPVLDPDDLDVSGMTGGAGVTYAPAATAPTNARDVAITFTAGTVGTAGITYQVDLDAGAYGSAQGSALALPTDGTITIDGYTFTLAAGATVNAGDVLAYSQRVDSGAAAAVCQVAAFLLLGSRGIDPSTMETLKSQNDAAIAWAKDIAKGEADLAVDADATPARAEAGPRYTGQRSPWEWLNNGRGW